MERDHKAMARSKRASSQRLKNRHSHSKRGHGRGQPALSVPATGDDAKASESLPTNWERYEHVSESELDFPTDDGQVHPKSKGANYVELLSSHQPQLFEDLPDFGVLSQFLLANSADSWEWDKSMYRSTDEKQTARDAAALFAVDLSLLGASLAKLGRADRLIFDEEVLLEESEVQQDVTSSNNERSNFEARDYGNSMGNQTERVVEWSQVDTDILLATPISLDATVEASYVFSINQAATESGFAPSAQHDSLRQSFSGSHSGVVGGTLTEKLFMKNKEPPIMVSRFEAVAAEAELDFLLDMLDEESSTVTGRESTGDVDTLSRKLSSFSILSRTGPAQVESCAPLVESSSGDIPQKFPVRTAGEFLSTANTKSLVQSSESKSHLHEPAEVEGNSADDNFDSWLDSI